MTRPPVGPLPPDDHANTTWITTIFVLLIIIVVIGLILGYDGESGRRLYSH